VVMAGVAGAGAALGFAGVPWVAGTGDAVGFDLVEAAAATAAVSDGGVGGCTCAAVFAL